MNFSKPQKLIQFFYSYHTISMLFHLKLIVLLHDRLVNFCSDVKRFGSQHKREKGPIKQF